MRHGDPIKTGNTAHDFSGYTDMLKLMLKLSQYHKYQLKNSWRIRTCLIRVTVVQCYQVHPTYIWDICKAFFNSMSQK